MRIQTIRHLVHHPKTQTARLKTDWLYTSKRYPLYWHHIAKNGGSYFKNLLYALDHDRLAERDSPAHDWDDTLVRAPRGAEDLIRDNPFSLIILRNPVHRFLSVYFDKVYHGDKALSPGMSRAFFLENDIDQTPDLTAEGHIENCLKLVEWGARNIRRETLTRPNWHLVPQMHQLTQVYNLNFRVLTLEDFQWQLPYVLEGLIPDIRDRMALIGKVNVSRKPHRKSEIATPELRKALKELYADDFAVFREVRQFWRDEKTRQEV